MLNFTVEERIKPDKEILELLSKTQYKVVNGAVKTIEDENKKYSLKEIKNILNQLTK